MYKFDVDYSEDKKRLLAIAEKRLPNARLWNFQAILFQDGDYRLILKHTSRSNEKIHEFQLMMDYDCIAYTVTGKRNKLLKKELIV